LEPTWVLRERLAKFKSIEKVRRLEEETYRKLKRLARLVEQMFLQDAHQMGRVGQFGLAQRARPNAPANALKRSAHKGDRRLMVHKCRGRFTYFCIG
jgi:hypothetical protein